MCCKTLHSQINKIKKDKKKKRQKKTLDSAVVRKHRICSNACGVLQIVKLYLNP